MRFSCLSVSLSLSLSLFIRFVSMCHGSGSCHDYCHGSKSCHGSGYG